MSTKRPGVDEPKTECPMCGLVWQEHTLNEVDGCMAIMRLEVSATLAKLKSKPSPSPDEIEICPVCNKLTSEHSDDDQRSCVSKWRKRERGSTGLVVQHSFLTGRFEGQEPDPLTRAQLQAKMMKALCPCGKTVGNHTVDEMLACAPRNRRPPRNHWGTSI